MSAREKMGVVVMRLRSDSKALFVGVATEVHRSIVFGSEITGAPGQPVDTGALRASWIPEFVSEKEWETNSNLDYAETIENNDRGATLRSSVGGFHSIALTEAGFPSIVRHVAAGIGP